MHAQVSIEQQPQKTPMQKSGVFSMHSILLSHYGLLFKFYLSLPP